MSFHIITNYAMKRPRQEGKNLFEAYIFSFFFNKIFSDDNWSSQCFTTLLFVLSFDLITELKIYSDRFCNKIPTEIVEEIKIISNRKHFSTEKL